MTYKSGGCPASGSGGGQPTPGSPPLRQASPTPAGRYRPAPYANKVYQSSKSHRDYQPALRPGLRRRSITLQSDEIDDLELSSSENRRIDALVGQLKNVESVPKKLQDGNVTLSNVRDLFDSIIEDYPDTLPRLGTSASIVHSRVFESAVVKVQRGDCIGMSREEREAVKMFEKPSNEESIIDNVNQSYAERALQRRTTGTESTVRKYIDLRFVLPTSNICERLFSKAGYLFNNRRRGMTPANFEAQVFLHINKDLWGPSDFTVLSQSDNNISDSE